jgi:hypothetical protein
MIPPETIVFQFVYKSKDRVNSMIDRQDDTATEAGVAKCNRHMTCEQITFELPFSLEDWIGTSSWVDATRVSGGLSKFYASKFRYARLMKSASCFFGVEKKGLAQYKRGAFMRDLSQKVATEI